MSVMSVPGRRNVCRSLEAGETEQLRNRGYPVILGALVKQFLRACGADPEDLQAFCGLLERLALRTTSA